MLYERVVAQFPTSGRYWRLYIEHEVKSTCIMWCSAVVLHASCLAVHLMWDLICVYCIYASSSVNLPCACDIKVLHTHPLSM